MAGNIKGITVEIGGDATPLNKALSEIKSQSKTLQTDLNQVNRLLKLDPTNVDLCAQKEELLAKQVQVAADRLKLLKDNQEQVNESFKKGDIGKETYQAFQREVISAEQKLGSLENKAQEFGDTMSRELKAAAANAGDLGGKLEEAGNKLSTASTVAAGALGVAALESANLEGAARKYVAATGESVEETERFKDVISGVYEDNWGESFDQIAADMQQVKNILGDMPDEQLQSVTEKAYMLQDTFSMDMNESIRGAQSLIDQFGISADEAFELMYQGCVKGLNQNQDLADQVAEYSTYYADAGFSATEFFDIMSTGSENGVYQIDYLNDAIKEFDIRMQDGSTTTSDALSQLGLNAQQISADFAAGGEKGTAAFEAVVAALNNTEDDLERNQLGVALFGTKWEDTGEKAILALGDIEAAGSGVTMTLDEAMNAVTDTAGAKTEKAFRELKTSLVGIGDVVMPIVAAVASALAAVATSIGNLPGPVQAVLATVLAAVAAAAPVLIFVGKISTGLGAIIPLVAKVGPAVQMASGLIGAGVNLIMPLISALSTAARALFVILAANPIGAIVAGIAAVIAIGVTLYNKCEGFRTFWDNLWASIKTVASTAIKILVNFFTVTIPTAFKNCYTKIKEFVTNFIARIKELPGKIKAELTKLINNVKTFATDLIKRGKQAATDFVTKMVNTIKDLPGKIKTQLNKFISNVKTFASDLIKRGRQAATDFVAKMVSLITGLPGKIKTQLNKAISNVKTFASNLVAKGKEAASDFLKKITSGLASLPGKMLEFGANVVRGFVNGIKNKIGAIADACSDMVGALTGKVASLLGLASPSRVLMDMGQNTGEGFVVGIMDKIRRVREAAQEMVGAVTQTVAGDTAEISINTGNYAAAANAAISGGSWSGIEHHTYDITIPLSVGGSKICELVSRLQYDKQLGRLRATGSYYN